MGRFDNLVAGSVGMSIISAFLIGLAESIGAVPFWIITVGVLALCLFDYYQSCIKKNGTKK